LSSKATDENPLQERLERIKRSEAESQMVGGLVHEFNSLLTLVRDTADCLEGGLPPHAMELRKEVERLRDHAMRGSRSVRNLLSLGRDQECILEPFHPRALLREFYPILRRLIPDHTEIEVSVQPSLPMILADRRAVEHILLNLCVNASDAMPTGGTLTLRLSEARHPSARPEDMEKQGFERPFVRLDVQDTGAGMDHRTLGRIFEPFFTTKGDRGSGLGMTMVLDLVQDQGGFLDADSEVGEGTTVSVFFPLAARLKAPEEASLKRQKPPGRKEKILIVEDSPTLRQTADQTLRMLGYEVLSAKDGMQALKVYRDQKEEVDLILTDLSMPVMDGLELRKELDDEGDSVPVLLSSGHSLADLKLLPGWDCSRPFLEKPWDLSDLARAIRGLLDGAANTRPGDAGHLKE
jgi:two-component system cell cycle sensor histidine kinase/response regulator CckA